MILIDTALERLAREGRTIKVAVVGAGFMVRGLMLQLRQVYPAIQIVAVAARRPQQAIDAYASAYKRDDVVTAETASEVSSAIAAGQPVVTDDPEALAAADGYDVLLEGTGSMDYALRAALKAIETRRHVVLMNAELDATVGPLLKAKADKAGVLITNVDGDQPGVEMNLIRYVRSLGYKPMLAASIKTLQDQHRNPETQRAFAERQKQNAHMVTSFADGSKVAFEQACVANAADMRVAKRGMIGIDPTNKDPTLPSQPLDDYLEMLVPHLDPDQKGIVEFIVGARPTPGVFVIGYNDDPEQRHYMDCYKMGKGPFYMFYTPYHLVHLEVPLTIARVALFQDVAVAPLGAPRVGVVATSKRDLKAGDTIDLIGGFDSYGEAENYETIISQNLLPMGIGEGCTLTRDVPKDTTLTYADVSVPPGRLIDKLNAEQVEMFAPSEVA